MPLRYGAFGCSINWDWHTGMKSMLRARVAALVALFALNGCAPEADTRENPSVRTFTPAATSAEKERSPSEDDAIQALSKILTELLTDPKRLRQSFEKTQAKAYLGNLDAQYSLGMKYSMGFGTPQDFVEAVRWFRKAAERGHDSAQLALAGAYFEGEGVPQDFVLVHMWSNLAAASGNALGAKLRDAIAAEAMTTAQIGEAQRLAREWRAKH